MLEFRILGPVTVIRDGQPVGLGGQQARMVLAQLLLADERPVSTDLLMDSLWGEQVPSTGRAALHNLIAGLRRALGDDAGMLATEPHGYALRYGSRGLVDLRLFESEVEQGRRALESDDPERAEALLAAALARWRGEALADLIYQGWVTTVAERLNELRLAAAELRIDAVFALGRHAEGIAEVRSLLAAYPLRESLYAQLLRGLGAAGRRGEALEAYQEWYRLTTAELGLEPSRELRDLQRSLLADEPSEHPRSARSVLIAASSVPGLRRVLTVASELGRGGSGHELILLLTTDPARHGVSDDQALRAAGTDLAAVTEGVPVRSAAVISTDTTAGALRIARHQDVDLVIVDGQETYPAAVPTGPCNMAVLASWPRSDQQGLTAPVLAPFGAAEHEWSALETAAWLARAHGVPLWLSAATGLDVDPSGMLATAGLLVQRFAGAATQSVLVEPGAEGVVQAAADAGLVVMAADPGGSRTVREEIVSRSPAPVMLVRHGLRPSGLAPADTLTRFSWSMQGN